MQTRLKGELSVFMFLQYFIWGAWYVSLAPYLGITLKFTGDQVGAAYGAFAIGAMISPFFVGLIADRYFASEKLLAVLGILGGVLMLALTQLDQFTSFYLVLIAYCATFAPTLALGNSLSLHHLADPKQDFPRVKMFSAIGWIAGCVTVSLLQAELSTTQFYVAGVASILLGLLSLALPHTPPRKVGQDVSLGEILGLDALALMKKPSFAIFIVCMFLICIPLYFYFVNMSLYLTEIGWTYPAAKMSLAQVSDVIFLFLLPVMLKRIGYKFTITIGILAWLTRYFLLAGSVDNNPSVATTAMIYGAILLHGVCYDFLFIAGQLYVDSQSNERIRGAAQGFIAFILWGVGSFVGTMLAGRVQAANVISKAANTHEWYNIWIIPAWLSVAVLVIFLIFFRDPEVDRTSTA